MSRWTLYHTAGCHLCEEAEEMVLACLAAKGLQAGGLELAEIAEDETLLSRYGQSIPVLRDGATGRELNWPFGPAEIYGIL